MIQKLIQEPLLHFLLIGASVFFFYSFQNTQNKEQIIISKNDIKQLSLRWNKKWKRAPTKEELDELIQKRVYQEVLYKEALKMGLEKNDVIIKRRLVQKLEFVTSDMAQLVEPTRKELEDYLKEHSNRFREPTTLSFMQLYIDPQKHPNMQAYSQKRLKALRVSDARIDGDDFTFEKSYQDLSLFDIKKRFGKAFTQKIVTLPIGSWQGNIYSGYGLHLVKIIKKGKGELRAFEKIKKLLKIEWQTQKQEQLNQKFYQELHQKYTIEIGG